MTLIPDYRLDELIDLMADECCPVATLSEVIALRNYCCDSIVARPLGGGAFELSFDTGENDDE